MSDNNLLGLGAAVLAVVMTFAMPVGARRVNQALIAVIIVVLCFVAAFSLFPEAQALGVGIVASLVAIAYRTAARWIRNVIWNVTKYTRRDYWYRRIGESVVNRGRRRRRW
jgi:predicted branched-subunit amino acid permease